MNDDLSYFENIDEAIICFESATTEELYSFLVGEDEIKKQIALLQIDRIFSQDDAEKIIFTLTEHSSETREYASFLVNRLMKNPQYRKYFAGDKILNKIERSIFDVNPKVCRKILEVLPVYEDLNKLFPLLINNSFLLIKELQEKNKNKNYQYNTKSFHLYWHIFAISIVLNQTYYNQYKNEINNLLEELSKFSEYTIREKMASLLNKIKMIANNDFLNFIELLSNDDNFYVKESILQYSK